MMNAPFRSLNPTLNRDKTASMQVSSSYLARIHTSKRRKEEERRRRRRRRLLRRLLSFNFWLRCQYPWTLKVLPMQENCRCFKPLNKIMWYTYKLSPLLSYLFQVPHRGRNKLNHLWAKTRKTIFDCLRV